MVTPYKKCGCERVVRRELGLGSDEEECGKKNLKVLLVPLGSSPAVTYSSRSRRMLIILGQNQSERVHSEMGMQAAV